MAAIRTLQTCVLALFWLSHPPPNSQGQLPTLTPLWQATNLCHVIFQGEEEESIWHLTALLRCHNGSAIDRCV